MTLVEVLAALAILAVVGGAALVARARYVHQYAAANRQLEATRIADQLLARWWADPQRLPRNDQGALDGEFSWRTQVVPQPEAQGLGLQIVRLQILDRRSSVEAIRASVDLALPLPSTQPTAEAAGETRSRAWDGGRP